MSKDSVKVIIVQFYQKAGDALFDYAAKVHLDSEGKTWMEVFSEKPTNLDEFQKKIELMISKKNLKPNFKPLIVRNNMTLELYKEKRRRFKEHMKSLDEHFDKHIKPIIEKEGFAVMTPIRSQEEYDTIKRIFEAAKEKMKDE